MNHSVRPRMRWNSSQGVKSCTAWVGVWWWWWCVCVVVGGVGSVGLRERREPWPALLPLRAALASPNHQAQQTRALDTAAAAPAQLAPTLHGCTAGAAAAPTCQSPGSGAPRPAAAPASPPTCSGRGTAARNGGPRKCRLLEEGRRQGEEGGGKLSTAHTAGWQGKDARGRGRGGEPGMRMQPAQRAPHRRLLISTAGKACGAAATHRSTAAAFPSLGSRRRLGLGWAWLPCQTGKARCRGVAAAAAPPGLQQQKHAPCRYCDASKGTGDRGRVGACFPALAWESTRRGPPWGAQPGSLLHASCQLLAARQGVYWHHPHAPPG